MLVKQNILLQWLSFYFFDAPKGILKAWRNFLLFNLNYFSIPILLKTLFSYWHRYRWYYPKGFNVGGYFSTLLSNAISRILGAMVRVFFIIIGILVEFFIIILGGLILLGWLILPFVSIAGLCFGFKVIF
ncbi:hypothetical protein ACFLYY_02430 [Patescibacteria group bacterium]